MGELSKALFNTKVGRYRFIMFLVTDDNIEYADEITTINEINSLTNRSNALTAEVKRELFTDNHAINILVYEFIKETSKSDAKLYRPSNLTAKTHLEKSKIIPILK